MLTGISAERVKPLHMKYRMDILYTGEEVALQGENKCFSKNTDVTFFVDVVVIRRVFFTMSSKKALKKGQKF